MKQVALYIKGWNKNSIFDINHKGNSDNWLMAFIELKNEFFKLGYDLNTIDMCKNPELLISYGDEYHVRYKTQYLVVYENEYIKRLDIEKLLPSYKKIFTWNDDWVDGARVIKYYYPQHIELLEFKEFSRRNVSLCLIANNKCVTTDTKDDMYLVRQEIIKFYENYPEEFMLYGSGWDLPFMKNNLASKINRKFNLIHRRKKLLTYQGRINHKSSAYKDSKFSICFENVKNINGYITEKIFDSFASGCVPIYIGPSNIHQYIPSDCYINYSRFNNMNEMRNYINSMDEFEYGKYQKNIISFLNSPAYNKFSAKNFCKIILENVIEN
jgi:hypothetical protein